MDNFLMCNRVFPFSFEPQNDDAVGLEKNTCDEVVLKFDMSVAECPQGCGFAFIFEDECPHSFLIFNFEQLEGSIDDLELKVELKLSGNRIYKQYYISGNEWIFIDEVRHDTAEICIVCSRTGMTIGKKGKIRIYT